MNTELEQRLHADMERATEGLRVPPGLALKAYRHHHKRTLTIRAATAAGAVAVLTAGTLTVAGVTGALGHPAPGPEARTTAYVISRVDRALSATSMTNVVGFTRTVYPAGITLHPAPGGLNGSGSPARSPRGGDYELLWAYRHISKSSAFTAAGQRLFDERLTIGNRSLATTVVSYTGRTWWTATQPRPPASTGLAPTGCLPGGQIRLSGGAHGGWPGFIHSQLACGAYTVVGTHAVGGVEALEITGGSGQLTLWVNAATYLPIRLDLGPLQTDFRWLSPTPAHLAMLNMHVPAGFRQVQPPS